MVESTAVSCIQFSHPDKNNNSVVRIISKEEEREDPRRELQSIFEYSGVSTNNTNNTRTTVFPHAIQQVSSHPVLFYIQNKFFSKKYYNYKAHPVQAPSSDCSPYIQAFYTAE